MLPEAGRPRAEGESHVRFSFEGSHADLGQPARSSVGYAFGIAASSA